MTPIDELGGYDYLITCVKTATGVTTRSSASSNHGCNLCPICEVASKKGYDFKDPNLHPHEKKYVVKSPFSNEEGVSGDNEPSSGKMCIHCWGDLGPGLHQTCDRNKKFENLQKRLSPQSREMLATDTFKKKKQEAEDAGVPSIALASRHGPNLRLPTAGASTSQPLVAKKNFFIRLVRDMSLTGRQATKAAKIYKEEVGGKVCLHFCFFLLSINYPFLIFYRWNHIWIRNCRQPATLLILFLRQLT